LRTPERYRIRPAVATLDRVTEPDEPRPSGARTGLWVGLGLLLGLVGGVLAGLLRSPKAAELDPDGRVPDEVGA
jgi:hypothetical protein